MAMTHDIGAGKKNKTRVQQRYYSRGLWIINRRRRNYTEGAWNVKKFRKNEHELLPRFSKGVRQENMMKR